ncbi:MAG: hypothetical protein KDK70_38290, partial [Myxococcales bacterium]|nr:hypothetical protein [Myxococcales bacterium]
VSFGRRARLRGIPLVPSFTGPLAPRADLAALLADPPPPEAIVTLPALTAPAAVALRQLGIRAVCCEHGGPLSHAALMARELRLSALVGCRGCTELPAGRHARLDTTAARLVLEPPTTNTDPPASGREALIDQLARDFPSQDEAWPILRAIGFPVEDTPRFTTPRIFWSQIVQAVEDGKVSGGLDALARAATMLRTRERTEYLTDLLGFDRRRRPLGDLLRDDPLLPQEVTMEAVEIPVLIERLDDVGSGSQADVDRRDLVLVVRELMEQGPRPVVMATGDVGTGKTTLLEQAVARLARDAMANPDAPLPLLLTASDLLSWPETRTSRARQLAPRPALRRHNTSGWIYFVDALDEVKDRDAVEVGLARLQSDPSTRAVVLASRPVAAPKLDPPAHQYRIARWTREEEARFEKRWAEVDPEGRILDGLWGNPLTVAISAAISRLAGDNASPAQLFALLVEKVFSGWAARRQPGCALPWAEIAPAYERLAQALLSSAQETFSRQQVHAILMREAPRQADQAWIDASNEIGLLRREPDGRYKFLSQPIAEHLAGASMKDMSYEDFVCAATAGWAPEPARHCIGLLAIENPNRALGVLQKLCESGADGRYAPYSLRLATIAVKAAADLGETAHPVVDRVCDALLDHLLDETSNWRPAQASRTIREL